MSVQYLRRRQQLSTCAQSRTTRTVLPAGTAAKIVVAYDVVLSKSFRHVDYNGTVGWTYNDWLK